MEGDVIVLATDGVFDNLYDKEIIEILARKSENPAGEISLSAYKNSIKEAVGTPFSEGSGGKYSGGKKDDITVIVVRV